MKFLRITRRTNGATVLINFNHIAALEQVLSETLAYTAVTLYSGREIDASETIEELLQLTGTHIVEM